MTHKEEDDIGAQVSSRLEEMFGENEADDSAGPAREPVKEAAAAKAEEATAEDEGVDFADSPLKNLKALVFGIDWEITDKSMKEFLEEIRELQSKYQNDKVLSTFLKLHESVGKYIKAKKARAHPEAIKFVTSVFKSFEKVLLNPEMPESRRKSLLSDEIKRFKDFREKILSASKKPGARQTDNRPEEKQGEAGREKMEESEVETEISRAEPAEPESGEPSSAEEYKASAVLENQEAIDYIVAELKKTIKSEFHTIRQIMKNLGA